jgi:hypothetical protein
LISLLWSFILCNSLFSCIFMSLIVAYDPIWRISLFYGFRGISTRVLWCFMGYFGLLYGNVKAYLISFTHLLQYLSWRIIPSTSNIAILVAKLLQKVQDFGLYVWL